MATLSVTALSRAGITQTLAAAASGGDQFANTGKEFFVVQNDHADTVRTVTFVTQQTVDSQAVADRTVTVAAAGQIKLVGPFPTGTYNNANDRVEVTYSDSAADLTVAVYSLTAV